MSRFLEELQNGRFIARTCHKCERILFPPRMFCEECFRPTDAWTFIHDTGTIETFSVSYLDTDAKRIAEPILVGVVSLDGATPKMGMMRSEEHTSELQSLAYLVCRLLLEKKKKIGHSSVDQPEDNITFRYNQPNAVVRQS